MSEGTSSLDRPRGAATPGGGALAQGMAAFTAGDLPGAHAAFEQAHRRNPRDPRAMSWYGVTLVLVERNITLGVSLCDGALRLGPDDPELLLNAARVFLALRQRQRAAKAISRGLAAWPGHPALLAARDALGTRRAPVLSFLSRDNPLNVALGRLRHRWATRRQPRSQPAPETLGLPVLPGDPPRS